MSLASENHGLAALCLPSSRERIVPGKTPEAVFREHEARYVFAGRFAKDKQILDVACGTGIGTAFLLKAGAQSCVGLDIHQGAIEYARAAYKGCAFTQCDAISLCLPDSSVDVVVSFETIEHLSDQAKFLQECERVLRPGGLLVCSTPNHAMYRWERRNPFHVRELTVAEFTHLLGTRFADIEIYAQENKTGPVFVARQVAIHLLGWLHLGEIVRKAIGRKPDRLSVNTEFDGSANNSDGPIQPYRPLSPAQPMYVIAVCRKRLY